MKPILSLRDLSWRLGIPRDRLRAIANNVRPHYRTIPLKKNGKVRMLRVPDEELMEIQRRIKTKILDEIGFASEAHGGIRGCSPRTNAAQHLGQPCVVNLDVKHFFPSVRHYVIYRMFRYELGFGHDVARLLTRLTTLDSYLPQGTPTSTALANLLLSMPVDRPISGQAKNGAIRYTRYVDDITMSGADPRPLIAVVARLLSTKRLPIYRQKRAGANTKFKVSWRSSRQEVTGLVVNSEHGPSLSQSRRSKVRAAVFELLRTDDENLEPAVQSVRGRINHVRQFNRSAATHLDAYLEATLQKRNDLLAAR